jgi:lysozyme
MKILLALIRRFEGCKLKAYLCPAGVWTLGWGATGPGISKGATWSQEQADVRLKLDAHRFFLSSLKASPVLALYPDAHQAIADFCFNLGTTRYRSSTLKKRIDAEDRDGACDEIVRWVFGGGRKLPGLVLRRQAEAAIIESQK